MVERARKVLVLVGVPVLAAVVVAAYAPWDLPPAVLWLVIAGGVLEAFPVKIGPHVSTSLSTIAMLFALLLYGPSAAVAVSLGYGVVVVALLSRGVRLVKGPYNMAMFVLSAALAAEVFALVAGMDRGPRPVELGMWIPAIVLAVIVYTTANNVLLSLALWVTGGPSPMRSLPGLFAVAWFGPLLATGFDLAAYVVAVEAEPYALVLLLVPLISARRSLAGVEAQRLSLDRAVRALVRLVEVKDKYTRGHAERVADLSDRVAQRLGLDATERYWIRIGAVLHDVGKIGVPLEVLNKPGRFTEEEYWQMRKHPDLGADLLENVDALAPAVPLVRQHHERIDGCGYPRGLSGDEVPLATRIVSAVDSWDAMTTTRPYREGLPAEVAVAELRIHTGTQFDARVVDALVAEVAPDLLDMPVPAPPPPRRPAAAPADDEAAEVNP